MDLTAIRRGRMTTRLPRKFAEVNKALAEETGKRRKYRNEPTVVDGIRFDSKAEAKRYCELKLLERAGEISDLQCQVRYALGVGDTVVCHYVADFAYRDKNDRPVTEDVKGVETRDFKLKAKLFRACFNRDIVLVRR